jgi:3',5'-cyclic AMP phosphodiesterase CpdA
VGVAALLTGRAARFPQDRLAAVVDQIAALRPEHLLITGDFTTTALPSEFAAMRVVLAPLLRAVRQVTVVPGNHDRYTQASVRGRLFEKTFAEFLPKPEFPWIKHLDDETVVLGLDPCRAHVSATGYLPPAQLDAARALLSGEPRRRILVACHYPVDVPAGFEKILRSKRLVNADLLVNWLREIGPHLYCCGHIHALWAFHPPSVPNQLCLNPGAPLMRSEAGDPPPGFLEIELADRAVRVVHHGWDGAGAESGWRVTRLADEQLFFTESAASV